MNVLVVARLAFLELCRSRLPLLPVLIAAFIGLATGMTIQINGAAVAPTGHLTESITWAIATRMLPSLGELVAVLAGAGALSVEIERGTVLLLACKLPRWALVLGKALGVYAFLLAAFALWAVVLVVGWSLKYGPHELGTLVAGVLLGALPALLAATIAVAFSSITTTIGAIVGSVATFLTRWVAAGVLATELPTSHPVLGALARGVQFALPTDRLGELAIALSLANPPQQAQWLALLAPLAWLALAMGAFERRDLSS